MRISDREKTIILYLVPYLTKLYNSIANFFQAAINLSLLYHSLIIRLNAVTYLQLSVNGHFNAFVLLHLTILQIKKFTNIIEQEKLLMKLEYRPVQKLMQLVAMRMVLKVWLIREALRQTQCVAEIHYLREQTEIN